MAIRTAPVGTRPLLPTHRHLARIRSLAAKHRCVSNGLVSYPIRVIPRKFAPSSSPIQRPFLTMTVARTQLRAEVNEMHRGVAIGCVHWPVTLSLD